MAAEERAVTAAQQQVQATKDAAAKADEMEVVAANTEQQARDTSRRLSQALL